MRRPNTKASGGSWSEAEKQAVWEKGTIVRGYDSGLFRRDICGAWMKYSEFGATAGNEHGWEIDHIVPVSSGGTDDPENLRPLHWVNNREKGEGFDDEFDCACETY